MRTSIRILTSLLLVACISGMPKLLPVLKSQTSLFGSNSAIVANYFVSASGNDTTGTGSINAPYATLNKVRAVVAADPNQGVKPIVVMLRGNSGPIYSSSTTFGAGDSGTPSAPITYEAYPGETPAISGGIHVTGWAKSTAGFCAGLTLVSGSFCWKTTLPSGTTFFERLWYNNNPRMRPRSGATANLLQGTMSISTGQVTNTGCGSSGSAICGFTYTPSDTNIANWTSCSTNRCEVWNFSDWDAPVGVISSINTGTHTINFSCTTNANCASTGAGTGGPGQNGERFQVEGMAENFKFAGQWYLDASTSTFSLYYISSSGEDPTVDKVEIGQAQQVLTIASLSNVTFAGIQIQNDGWDIPATGYNATQLDPNLSNSLVSCDACTSVNFIADTFTNTTSTGLRLTGSSNNMVISNNVFRDIGAYGAQLGIQGQQTVCVGGTCSDSLVPHNITFTQNWVEYTSRFIPSGDGVMVGIANNITISFNDIGWAYDKGIEVCMPIGETCKEDSAEDHDIVITNNDIHNITQGILSDAAGFYAATEFGTNNVFQNNRVHDVQGGAVQNSSELDIGVHCIYLDDQTGLWTVQNNLAYRCMSGPVNMNDGPQAINQANLIKNNVLIDGLEFVGSSGAKGGSCVQIRNPAGGAVTSFTYQSNICMQDLASATLVNPEAGSTTQGGISTFTSNIYSFAGTPRFNISGSGSGNSFAQWQAAGFDTTGTISTTPHFTAPGNCAGNSTVPILGVCDDFTFTDAGPGHGFSTAAFTGVYGPTSPKSIPVVIATFHEATLNPSQF